MSVIIAEHSKTSTIVTIMIAATGALRRGGRRTDSKITVTERWLTIDRSRIRQEFGREAQSATGAIRLAQLDMHP